jgi:[protein-PII] uridylyltransferase
MSGHVDKVLANAERELGNADANRPAEILPLYKRFLKIEEHRLRLKHQAGGGGREVARRRAELVDILLKHVFESAAIFAWNKKQAEPTSLTLVALGGYGRGELNPFSDVDVLFLHDRSAQEISPYVQLVVEQVLYLLWDIGFKVGHSTQSIDEAIAQANSDMLMKTAMLESRELAGDPAQWERFRSQFRSRCVEGHEAEYIGSRLKDQAERHAKFGGSVYMQEPNLKNGCGGLRDYQNLLWMAFFNAGVIASPSEAPADWWSEAERNRITSIGGRRIFCI